MQVRNTRFGSEDVEAGMHIVAPVRRAFTAPRYCRFSLNFEARRVYFSHHVLQAGMDVTDVALSTTHMPFADGT